MYRYLPNHPAWNMRLLEGIFDRQAVKSEHFLKTGSSPSGGVASKSSHNLDSGPLESLGLVDRKTVRITPSGYKT